MAGKKKAAKGGKKAENGKKPANFMEEQAEQDKLDSTSELLGKHMTKCWELARECESWIRPARGTASPEMKVTVAKRVRALASELEKECGNLLRVAVRRGVGKA